MNRTKIDWGCFPQPLLTVNPFIGCSHASEGCKNCYAEAMANRLAAIESQRWEDWGQPYVFDFAYCRVTNEDGWNGKTLFLPERLEAVRKRRKPATVFWCSMSDLFHENNRNKDINETWMVIQNTKHLHHVILTKRPDRMMEWTERAAEAKQWPVEEIWPENVWLGVTAENQQRAEERIPILLSISGNHKTFVSVEPMLGEIDLRAQISRFVELGCEYGHGMNLTKVGYMKPAIDLIIIGAETGANRRPCRREWIENLQQQCADAGVQCYLKDNGVSKVEVKS